MSNDVSEGRVSCEDNNKSKTPQRELSEQEVVRRRSMQTLRDRGIEPYPAKEFTVTGRSAEIKENFRDDAEPRPVAVAGRIMSRRIMGKASFVELQDSEGRIQVYVSRDDICPGEDKSLYNDPSTQCASETPRCSTRSWGIKSGTPQWAAAKR